MRNLSLSRVRTESVRWRLALSSCFMSLVISFTCGRVDSANNHRPYSSSNPHHVLRMLGFLLDISYSAKQLLNGLLRLCSKIQTTILHLHVHMEIHVHMYCTCIHTCIHTEHHTQRLPLGI